jgi:uncharacterized protein YutE (UPF0331/DUF86 family)
LAAVDDVILERLILLRNEVDYLRTERDSLHSFQQYVESVRLKRAVERSLQVAIEICLDVGRRLISVRGFRYPNDNQDVFRILAEEGVLPQDLLSTMLDMTRFRNLIVHDYARVDDAKVYAILRHRLADFDAFAAAIAAYLETG